MFRPLRRTEFCETTKKQDERRGRNMARIGLNSEPVALSADTVDKLIGRGSGDAALLYLYLLRTGGEYSSPKAQKALGWNAAQVMSAFEMCIRDSPTSTT